MTAAPKKILFILTSHEELGNTGKKTGWYAEEAGEPATILSNYGYEIVWASPKGGKAPLDPGSVDAAKVMNRLPFHFSFARHPFKTFFLTPHFFACVCSWRFIHTG